MASGNDFNQKDWSKFSKALEDIEPVSGLSYSALKNIFQAAEDLLILKHKAYGPKNISQAPGGPMNGLRVRMHDKMARLNHLLENPDADMNDESLRDTLIDLMNYCAIAMMVLEGSWPK